MSPRTAVTVVLAGLLSIAGVAHADKYDDARTDSSERADVLGMGDAHASASANHSGHLTVAARATEEAPVGLPVLPAPLPLIGASSGEARAEVVRSFPVEGPAVYRISFHLAGAKGTATADAATAASWVDAVVQASFTCASFCLITPAAQSQGFSLACTFGPCGSHPSIKTSIDVAVPADGTIEALGGLFAAADAHGTGSAAASGSLTVAQITIDRSS